MPDTATPEAAELLIQLLADPKLVLHRDAATWMSIAREGARQGVLPLVHARLRAQPPGAVPAEVLNIVNERYIELALQSSLIFRELADIATALGDRGVPLMLLKGLHLAVDVYDARPLRTMGDIDIMVPRDRLADAERALAAAGFGVQPVADLTDFCRTNPHLPRMAPPRGRGIGVEVHWTIERPTSPFDIRHEELWAHARTIDVDGRAMHVLTPEHLALHLCLHACFHHRFEHTPLKQLCDLAVLLKRYREEIDWDVLIGTAERWRVGPFVRFTLLLTHELLGAEVPNAIQALPADPEEARLLENARAFILNCTIAVPTAFRQAVRARSLPKRMSAAAGHLFPPPARMAAIYNLRRGSARMFAWYLVRPFDLLLRKGRMTMELLMPGRARRRLRYSEENRAMLKQSLREWAHGARPPAGHA